MAEWHKEGCGRSVDVTYFDTERTLPYGMQKGRGSDRSSDTIFEAETQETRRGEDEAGVGGV